ncbi:MAG: hypothetical protein M1133_06085, partial [Armatimonadetes bacterium]|nr:hypothetical protein [Armatimonadota bacterium]
PASVESEWRRLAGEEYEAGKAFLRPRQELADYFPCPREQPCGCLHDVVIHAEDDIVAVCACDPPHCDTIRIAKSDIIVHELDTALLCAAVSGALSLQPAQADVPDLLHTTRLGFDSPCAGFKFPAFLTIQLNADKFRRVAFTLAARYIEPFILIAPTDEMCGPDCMEILSVRKSLFLTLADIFALDGAGRFVPASSCADALARFHGTVVPGLEPDSNYAHPIAFFPTPPDASWDDVSIRFLDGHSVSVSVKDKSGVYHFTQMGMSKKNAATPTAQWKLLEAFADGHGVFDWNSEHASRNQKKQKQLLSQALRRFFRLEDDPFRYVSEYKGWEARFYIEPCE